MHLPLVWFCHLGSSVIFLDARVAAMFSHETIACLVGYILAVTIAFYFLKGVIKLMGVALDAIRCYGEESESGVWLCTMDAHIHRT